MTSILLADDNSELCSALRLMLQTRLALETIEEAHDMEQVLTAIKKNPHDCLIMDWELPGHPTSERVLVLRLLAPNLKIIALSARPEAEREALAEGVDTFISKINPPEQVAAVIRQIIDIGNNFEKERFPNKSTRLFT